MYKFFVGEDQVEEEKITIIGNDVNHIKNVLRMEIGKKIQVCSTSDSANYDCEIKELNENKVICEILKKIETTNEPDTYLHIFQGLPKAEKMELIIQKTIEVGASEITPVVMERCVVKLDSKSAIKKVDRWNKIAEVAAKQSKRDIIPKVNNLVELKNLKDIFKEYDIVITAYEEEKEISIKKILKQYEKNQIYKIAVIIGPEGGISPNEIENLKQMGSNIVTLGPRILRTETAPIVLASTILYEFDEMN